MSRERRRQSVAPATASAPLNSSLDSADYVACLSWHRGGYNRIADICTSSSTDTSTTPPPWRCSNAIFRMFLGLRPGRKATFSAARYGPGHWIDPHDDRQYRDVFGCRHSREVALVYYLNKDWSADMGGMFVDMEDPKRHVRHEPEFNSAVVFRVPRWHAVVRRPDPASPLPHHPSIPCLAHQCFCPAPTWRLPSHLAANRPFHIRRSPSPLALTSASLSLAGGCGRGRCTTSTEGMGCPCRSGRGLSATVAAVVAAAVGTEDQIRRLLGSLLSWTALLSVAADGLCAYLPPPRRPEDRGSRSRKSSASVISAGDSGHTGRRFGYGGTERRAGGRQLRAPACIVHHNSRVSPHSIRPQRPRRSVLANNKHETTEAFTRCCCLIRSAQESPQQSNTVHGYHNRPRLVRRARQLEPVTAV